MTRLGSSGDKAITCGVCVGCKRVIGGHRSIDKAIREQHLKQSDRKWVYFYTSRSETDQGLTSWPKNKEITAQATWSLTLTGHSGKVKQIRLSTFLSLVFILRGTRVNGDSRHSTSAWSTIPRTCLIPLIARPLSLSRDKPKAAAEHRFVLLQLNRPLV